jgi:hypothetical protein
MTAVIRVYGNVVETHEHEAILRNGELLISTSYMADSIRHALPIIPFTFSNCVLVLHALESCLESTAM